MEIPVPHDLLERIRALPAAGPLTRLAESTSQTVALVGGAVRDLLLGLTPLDVDVVVEGGLAEIVDRLGGAVRSHDRFRTVQVTIEGRRFDFASARRERYSLPGSLPHVTPATLAADLGRRDFTVNAIAVPLNGPSAGELLAVPRAYDDLDTGTLRVLHPESFIDDPTRLLRLARYAARLDFVPEPETVRLAARALQAGAVATVSGPRIGNELRLLGGERDPVKAFGALRELGVDRAIDADFGLTDDAWAARAIELLGPGGRPDRLILALAVRRITRRRAQALLERLAFTSEDRAAILDAAGGVVALSDAIAQAARSSELASAVAGASPEAIALAGALGPGDAAGRWLSELRHVELAIDGHDLLDAGVAPGPAIGHGLRAAYAAALDGVAVDRGAQLEVAVAAAGGRPGDRQHER